MPVVSLARRGPATDPSLPPLGSTPTNAADTRPAPLGASGWAALVALTVAAVALRWAFVDFVTSDYTAFLAQWYDHLKQAGGFPGLADEFANYNTPYLVLLAALTYLPVPALAGIKAISIAFDLLLAFFAFRIVRLLRPDARWLQVGLTGAVLLLPTAVMNGGVWGQCDSIYASLCLGSLYFLMTKRGWSAAGLFGLAFAFKLQAIFFAPVLLIVFVVNRMKLRALLAAPAAFLAALVPAMLAGRSLLSQLLVYPGQITNSSGGGFGSGGGRGPGGGGRWPGTGGGGVLGGAVGSGHAFTYNAPTPYAWLGSDASTFFKYFGIGLAGLVVFGLAVWVWHQRPLTPEQILAAAASSALIVPLLLPEMHERYFYLAEVLLLVAVAIRPAWLIPAMGIQAASAVTYLAFLRGSDIVPLGWLAALAAVAGVSAAFLLRRELARRRDEGRALSRPEVPDESSAPDVNRAAKRVPGS